MNVELPKEAKVDLGGAVNGNFTAEDWQSILKQAEQELQSRPWSEVVRDFYVNGYWGYKPRSRAELKKIKPKSKRGHMGVKLIWITFQTMCVTKVIVLWLGQKYARSAESSDFLYLLLAIFLVLANFAYFLWSQRDYRD